MSKDLPKGHIANKKREIDAHGKHVDLIVPTSYGSHQVRVIEAAGKSYAIDPATNKIVGELRYDFKSGGSYVIEDDQHNFRNDFIPGRERFSIDVGHPDYWANRNDRMLPNSPGTFDPRGTAMGGYNPRR